MLKTNRLEAFSDGVIAIIAIIAIIATVMARELRLPRDAGFIGLSL